MRRLALTCLAAALAAWAGGCGTARQQAPATPRPAAPVGHATVSLAQYGVSFQRPRNWRFFTGVPPRLASISSGEAVVAMWRYRRVERLPVSTADLARARKALLATVRGRDRTIRIASSRALRLSGVPGIEILANEQIGATRRRVRSTHLFGHGIELVVDAYAPAGQFAAVDRSAFVPLLRSLRMTAPTFGGQ